MGRDRPRLARIEAWVCRRLHRTAAWEDGNARRDIGDKGGHWIVTVE
jgi:hypothetical protein